MKPASVPWPADHLELARAMWADGRRVREIAQAVGRSRSSVIGKMRRVGAARHPEAKVHRSEVGMGSPSVALLRSKAWRALPGTSPVPLVDLERGMCRWPIGDKPVLFCGCATKDEATYCPTHHVMSIGEGTPSERTAIKAARNITRREQR